MPFSNIQQFKLNFSNLVVTVNSFVHSSCEQILTISASYNGILSGHTFLWEQISGTPVTWLEPLNQTSVTYNNNGIRDDKVFRLYVDKDTVIEQVFDILVSSVARDFLYIKQNSSEYLKDITYYSPSTISFIAPAISESGITSINTSPRMVVFNIPDTSNIAYIELQQYINNSYIPVQVTMASSNFFNNLLNNTTYRLANKLTFPPNTYSYGSPFSSTYPIPSTLEYAITDQTIVMTPGKKDDQASLIEIKFSEILSQNITETILSTLVQIGSDHLLKDILEIKFLEILPYYVDENSANSVHCASGIGINTSELLEIKPLQNTSLG